MILSIRCFGNVIKMFIFVVFWFTLRVRGRVRTRTREGFVFNCLSLRNLGRYGLEIRRQYYRTAFFCLFHFRKLM